MVSGTNKLKVVWICRFMNDPLLRLLKVKDPFPELGPWISLGIEEIKKRQDVDLHVIAPFPLISWDTRIHDGNIHYHFIKTGVPFIRRNWWRKFRFDLITRYFFFNWKVRQRIGRIKPDIVNLHGAENANYSSSILNIKNLPVLISIQGFIGIEKEMNQGDPGLALRVEVEDKILKQFGLFHIEASFMARHIQSMNPSARFYWLHYPFKNTEIQQASAKEYDLVYFARITRNKGIEDLLQALSIIRDRRPQTKLCVIGKGSREYTEQIKSLVTRLHLGDNVEFKGFFPTQADMHKEVVKARISVLPTYNDTIPGTVVESMLLGVPVVSYNTGGLPDINLGDERIVLVEQGQTGELANRIMDLLGDPEKLEFLAEKARKYAVTEFDNAKSIDLLIQAYHDVIKRYKENGKSTGYRS